MPGLPGREAGRPERLARWRLTTSLLSPTGAIVDSLGFLKEVGKDAIKNGAEYIFGEEVISASNGLLETNKNLRDLSLGHNQIGDEGTQALANALQQNETLQFLTLDNNSIGDGSINENP